MITSAFILIKALFVIFIIKLYKKLKTNTLKIENLDHLISESRQKVKYLYLLSFILLIIGIIGNITFEDFFNSKPFEEKIIGEWKCQKGTKDITFFDNDYFEMDSEPSGTWEIVDSLLTLRFENENQDFEILELTHNKLDIFYRPEYKTISCKN